MKVELEIDESWNLMSYIVNRMLEETPLSDEDRAKVRRWRSEEMRPTSDEMRLLTEKINRDLNQAIQRKQRSAIQKHDWSA
jgi:hypothetical protein